MFSAAKLFFAYGLGNSLTFPLSVGATTVLLAGRPTPQAVQEKLHAHNATIFFGVPTLYAAMLADKSCTPETGSSQTGNVHICRRSLAARSVGRLAQPVRRRDMGWYRVDRDAAHFPVQRTAMAKSAAPPARRCRAMTCAWWARKARTWPTGEIGELLVSGASCCNGYWNKRDKTRSTFEGNWARTGDKYIRDEEGFYQYCGRTDDMFKVSGIWVSPFEVESALVSHEAVLEAAVVAHEDDEGLVKPKAFVVLNDGLFGRWPVRRAEGARQDTSRSRGSIRAGSSSCPTCRRPRPARSSVSSCAHDRAGRLS